MSDTVDFFCSNCGHEQEVDAALVGKSARCPHCNTVSVIKAAVAKTAPPPMPATTQAVSRATQHAFGIGSQQAANVMAAHPDEVTAGLAARLLLYSGLWPLFAGIFLAKVDVNGWINFGLLGDRSVVIEFGAALTIAGAVLLRRVRWWDVTVIVVFVLAINVFAFMTMMGWRK